MFTSADDFVARSGLNDSKLTRLAEAGAFSGFEDNRRTAIWQVKGLARTPPSPLALKEKEKAPVFENLNSFDTIDWDYQTMAHSTHGHPLAPLRTELEALKLPDARDVSNMHDGVSVRYVGMVICRQRPLTAGGVVFLTLEDETGFVNVVVWRRVFQANALLIKSSNFLGVSGTLQKEDGVAHLIADSFWDPHTLIEVQPASGGSRDFH